MGVGDAKVVGTQHVGVNIDPLTLSFSGGAGACLTEEADGADLKAEPLVGFPKVIQHDIDDGQLVDAGSVDLHHCL